MRRIRRIQNPEPEPPNYIVGALQGGLGNQLFVIFATIAHGLENDCESLFINIERVRRTYFDTSLYDNVKLYHKNLGILNRYNEKGFEYEPIPRENNLLLQGYFQSYKYFHKYRDVIIDKLDIFKLRKELDNFDGYLHFRIGDYKNHECHPVCDINYYIKCFDDIEKKEKKENKRFVYFYEEKDKEEVTNKIDILRNKFPNIEFVPIDTKMEDYLQMLSMTTLKYCVIANSSFSWWGAYLNNRNDKKVYHPQKWFSGSLGHYNIKDLIPEDWKVDNRRNAYLLTLDKNSRRAKISENLLSKIGFDVIFFEAIKDKSPMISHRKSMYAIYEKILLEEKNKNCYVFEDDINTLIDIDLKYIINYEKLDEDIYYLGYCYNKGEMIKQNIKINDHFLYKIKGGVRGLHSICITKKGAEQLKKFYDSNPDQKHMDVLIEKYTLNNPLYVIREDLVSPCHPGHFGIFYQDRDQFKSDLEKCKFY